MFSAANSSMKKNTRISPGSRRRMTARRAEDSSMRSRSRLAGPDQRANFTDSHGIDHPSQPNYLALFSGDPQGTGSDAKRNPDGSNPIVNGHTQVGTNDPPPKTPLETPNLGAALIRAGRSFVGYSEDLPIRGFTGVSRTGPPGSGID